MSIGVPSRPDAAGVSQARAEYRMLGGDVSAAPSAVRSAAAAAAGIIVDTSPPNAAISLTRLELT